MGASSIGGLNRTSDLPSPKVEDSRQRLRFPADDFVAIRYPCFLVCCFFDFLTKVCFFFSFVSIMGG